MPRFRHKRNADSKSYCYYDNRLYTVAGSYNIYETNLYACKDSYVYSSTARVNIDDFYLRINFFDFY